MAAHDTKRSPEIESRIISGLEKGETLAEMCRELGIGRRTVYDWVDGDPEFAARFAHARELGFDAIAESVLEIADDGTNDYVEKRRQDGSKDMVYDAEHVQRSKLRVDARLKLLAKWSPKKYGERTQIAPTDGDGNDLQMAPIMFAPVKAKADE